MLAHAAFIALLLMLCLLAIKASDPNDWVIDMTILTENPNLDERTRETVAAIEESAMAVIAAGDTASQALQLAELVDWEHALQSAIAENETQIAQASGEDAGDGFLQALQGLDRCFHATLFAARELQARLRSSLQTVRVAN